MSCGCVSIIKNKINSCMDLLYMLEYKLKKYFYSDNYKKGYNNEECNNEECVELEQIIIKDQPQPISRRNSNSNINSNSNSDEWIVI